MNLPTSTGARRLAAAVLGAMLLVTIWIASGNGDQTSRADPATRLFSETSFWNARLPGNAPLDTASPLLVSNLVSQVRTHGAWINSRQYSTPIYTVGPKRRGVPVTIDTPSATMYTNDADAAALQRQLTNVPIPKKAHPALGSDRHMVIWQPSTDTVWELWVAYRLPQDISPWKRTAPLGWHAGWGARIDHVSQSSGVDAYPFGATASGLPMAGGLMRVGELRSGSINHALAMAIPATAQGHARAPATRTDGQDPSPTAIPEGTRFRLDPAVDVKSLHLHPIAEQIALAAQRYGVVVRDRADAVAFYAEDPRGYGGNPYASLFGGKSPAQILDRFPWEHMQALPPTG